MTFNHILQWYGYMNLPGFLSSHSRREAAAGPYSLSVSSEVEQVFPDGSCPRRHTPNAHMSKHTGQHWGQSIRRTHTDTHGAHRHQHHRQPPPVLLSKKIGIGVRACTLPQSWFPGKPISVISLSGNTDFKSFWYLRPISTRRLRPWVFLCVDLFLPMKFISC